ncbi:MAG: nucleotidyl transferase AbiEii/AbiGii toxin family protein [Patescibacteria group bacterium]
MEEIKAELKRLIRESPTEKALFRRNILKEYLQIVVLDFMYSHPVYGQLVFYGGSCLAQCYGLPRLSEDLDFVDLNGAVDIKLLAEDLARYFNEKTDINAVNTMQKFRVHLKFPILRELGLSGASDSDFLMLKVEVFRDDGRLRDCPREIVPMFKMNRSILVRTFDLPTLMAT